MDLSKTYRYFDGNGNDFTLTPTKLVYAPVRKEESSSGQYSGGDAKTVGVTPAQFEAIEKLMTTAESNVDSHIEARVMMSAEVVKLELGKRTRFILRPGCAEQVAIEKVLRDLLK